GSWLFCIYMLSSLTRLIPLLLMLAFVAPSVASAKTLRVQCEDGGSRCENAVGTGNDSAMEIARHRPSGPQRRIEAGEPAPRAPARVVPATRKVPSERERTAGELRASNEANGDAAFTAAPASISSATEPAGLGPWARVLAIIMGAAGLFSLIV